MMINKDHLTHSKIIHKVLIIDLAQAKLENGENIAVKMLYNNTPSIDDVQFQREFENLMSYEASASQHCKVSWILLRNTTSTYAIHGKNNFC
jgi:hypothetical protein